MCSVCSVIKKLEKNPQTSNLARLAGGSCTVEIQTAEHVYSEVQTVRHMYSVVQPRPKSTFPTSKSINLGKIKLHKQKKDNNTSPIITINKVKTEETNIILYFTSYLKTNK